jgi:hypothetical protein
MSRRPFRPKPDAKQPAPTRQPDSRGNGRTAQPPPVEYAEQRGPLPDQSRSTSTHGSAPRCTARSCDLARLVALSAQFFDSVASSSDSGVKVLRGSITDDFSELLYSARQSLYQPLAPWQTRLVRLSKSRPNAWDGTFVQADLLTVDFADIEGVGITGTTEVVQYSAVSHVWNKDSTASEIPVYISGNPVMLTADVASILERLTPDEGLQYIW